MSVIFGPSGLGKASEAVSNLEEMAKKGIKACEIAFTYGVYIKDEKDIRQIRECAEKLGIKLSIHSQYFINLNSNEKAKIEASKKRILECCETGEKLGCYAVVFHPGFFGKKDKEESYQTIKKNVIEIMEVLKEKKWKIQIMAETMGKVNVFGSVSDIKRLVKETHCSFCLDFAHLKARTNGKMSYMEMVEEFKEFKDWHCHFSGIVYGDKGEKHHILTPKEEMKELFSALKKVEKTNNIVIINESPDPLKDASESVRMWEK